MLRSQYEDLLASGKVILDELAMTMSRCPDDNKYRIGLSSYIYLFYYSLGLFNVK